MPRPRLPRRADPIACVGYAGPLPDVDVERLGAGCAALGLRLIAMFRDPAPATPLNRRDGLVDALAHVERVGAGVLATPDVVTIVKDFAEHAVVRRAVERAGARWLPLDPAVPWTEEAVGTVLAALVQHESLVTKPKSRLGMSGGPHGRPITRRGGRTPFGYRREADGRLVPVPAEQDVVREIVRRRRDGESLGALAGFVDSTGLREGPTSKSSVRAILDRAAREDRDRVKHG